MANLLSPPRDLDAERAVLGSLLLERDAIVAVASWLRAEHFDHAPHGMIYAAVAHCYEQRIPPDVATVASVLRDDGLLDALGGIAKLVELVQSTPTAMHVEYYGRIVEALAARRRLADVGHEAIRLAYKDDAELSADTRIDRAAQLLVDLQASRVVGSGFVTLSDVASELYDEAARVEDTSESALLGVSTGYPALDDVTHGLKAGELIVLAARPGVGKTSLMLCLAHNVAEQGVGVGIWSLEMDRQLLLQRLLSVRTGVSTTQIMRRLARGDQELIAELGKLSELPIYVDHTPAISVAHVRNTARKLSAQHEIGVWMLDYLQLASSSDARADFDDVRRISAISGGLTAFAREQRKPFVVLSQLSRAVEGRASNVPKLSDLRGSGSIEQDASQVWFIYRDELYDEESDKRGIAEIIVEKHRGGPTGVAPLRFERSTTAFHSLERYTPRGSYADDRD